MRFALPLCLALAAPAVAQEMSDAERDTFRAEVRAYLLENPEVIMEAIGVLQAREDAAKALAERNMVPNNAAALFDDPSSFVGGNPDGDITIVEFMDYRCGYCKRAFPEVQALLQNDGNIRYIIKEYPVLGDESVLAAKFALAVKILEGDETYETVHNTLMQFRGEINQPNLDRLAAELGLDTADIQIEMEGPIVAAILRQNQILGQRMQVSGTPTFTIEEQLVRGYIPGPQMEQLIAELRMENDG